MPAGSEVAASFAALAVRNIGTEFPHATQHLVRGTADPHRPRDLHPAFHGAYDWHSCVHMHWLLVQLRTDHPDLVDIQPVESTLDITLTPEALRAEAAYLRANPWFERPYGWAWAVRLAAACARCPDRPGARWSVALAPLVDTVEELVGGWLSHAAGPVRHGVHTNTAFAFSLLLDAAGALGRPELAARCARRARDWFAADRAYPATWEPSGQDFLSPALCEADLMRRVLPAKGFPGWLADFLPELATGGPAALMTPATVLDAEDGHQGHLYGLNLSRAWQFRALAEALPSEDPRVAVLRAAADQHLAAGLPAVSTDTFVHGHWLATFAYLALTA
jgi:Protein of unknown function (DUF2891)